MPTQAQHGIVGIGLRHPHYQAFLSTQPTLGFVEVHGENFFSQGGAALAMLSQVRKTYALSVHGVGLSLGSACGLDLWHLDQLARLVERFEPCTVSDHACFGRVQASSSGAYVHAHDLLPLAFTQASLDILSANVSQVQDRLQRPILVENLSAYLAWADADMSEPDFFNQLVKRTGCGLLLDVNNLVVNALNQQVDPILSACAWIDALDERCGVGEIHLAGHQDLGSMVIDDHGSAVPDNVWQVFRHALKKFGPVPTLIEWDTCIPSLGVLLQEAMKAQTVLTSTST
jgi:uncharacterized protein